LILFLAKPGVALALDFILEDITWSESQLGSAWQLQHRMDMSTVSVVVVKPRGKNPTTLLGTRTPWRHRAIGERPVP